ncbi:hypothetical protein YB2330_006558 [Saitoella coloradoensis]
MKENGTRTVTHDDEPWAPLESSLLMELYVAGYSWTDVAKIIPEKTASGGRERYVGTPLFLPRPHPSAASPVPSLSGSSSESSGSGMSLDTRRMIPLSPSVPHTMTSKDERAAQTRDDLEAKLLEAYDRHKQEFWTKVAREVGNISAGRAESTVWEGLLERREGVRRN